MDERGMDLWRQISDTLIREIGDGVFAFGAKLPASADLAARFGVNRHTVLKALAHLQSEGLLRIERGRGTFVAENPIQFRLGAQNWFEQNLLEAKRIPTRRVLAVAEMPGPETIATALQIEVGAPTVLVMLLGEANGCPFYHGSHYFPTSRLPGIAEIFRSFGTLPSNKIVFADILSAAGCKEFKRGTIRLRSRRPSRDEARHLEMAPSDHVLQTEITLVDSEEVPVTHAFSCYSSRRVELVLES